MWILIVFWIKSRFYSLHKFSITASNPKCKKINKFNKRQERESYIKPQKASKICNQIYNKIMSCLY